MIVKLVNILELRALQTEPFEINPTLLPTCFLLRSKSFQFYGSQLGHN